MEDDVQVGRRQPVKARIANACDSCKARKVKCDGNLPCGYCTRRQRPSTCHYSPQHRRRTAAPRARRGATPTPTPTPALSARDSNVPSRDRVSPADHRGTARRLSEAASPARPAAGPHHDALADEETEVPREARLLRDAQGKLIFIGDCAPLSFFQTVRQLVSSRVDAKAFVQQAQHRFSVWEAPRPKPPVQPGAANAPASSSSGQPELHVDTMADALVAYASATSGLVDLFDHARLVDDVPIWASQTDRPADLSSAVHYLVLAIGYQVSAEGLGASYFDHARNIALMNLNGNPTVATVQAFVLITLYMLGLCQANGAFLFCGIAVRAAYSIGVHRTEVNARFGSETQRQRDYLWKSLRVLDLFLSTSMGRPPGTSDVDCTVPYTAAAMPQPARVSAGTDVEDYEEPFDVLNASVQIFLIAEEVVLEVYSRKKISYQLTEGISRRLRDWSIRWLHRLKSVIATATDGERDASAATGACQVLCSYYYAVILVSRPFLMYELHRRLSSDLNPSSNASQSTGKSKLADACIDAATFMVEPVTQLIDKGHLQEHMPLIVSWLFASSLVLGVGLLGSFGRVLEKYTRGAIRALEHFARNGHDTHAGQYAVIARSLLATALEHLERKEMSERLQRSEASAQLFGLDVSTPPGTTGTAATASVSTPREWAIATTSDGATPRHAAPRPQFESSGFGSSSGRLPGFAAAGPTGASGAGFTPGYLGLGPLPFGDVDAGLLGLSSSMPRTPDLSAIMEGRIDTGGDGSFGGDINLFHLLDGEGHIDLGPFM